MNNLGTILGATFSVDTAENINAEIGKEASAFLDDLPKPAPDSEAQLLVVSADCKGVPLVKEDAAKVAAFETAKKNPGNRRMATVASVYTVEPHVRTAEEITAALFRDVISGLRRMGTTHKLSGKAAEDLARIFGYLEKNSDRMRYDEYLRRGYPIASGVIEGACRHLVKDRMERSGMRWTLEGARSMLHVRATFQSDHWRSFLDHRIKYEAQLNHQHREILGDYQPLTLAC